MASTTIDVPSFVSSKLRGDQSSNNYESWKEQVLRLLESQGLVGFIDGEAPPPPSDDADYGTWRRTDWLIKGWILGTLSDEAVPQSVVSLERARDVWLVLEKYFSQDQITEEIHSVEHALSSASVVSTKLSGHRKWNNYASWKQQVLGLLETQGLVRFINGETRPPLTNDIEWRRTDWLVKGWILGALSDNLLQNVVNLDSARDVWLVLENEFSTYAGGNSNYYPPAPPPSTYPPPPPRSNYPPQSNFLHAPPPSNNYLPTPPNYPVAPPPSNYPPLLPSASNYPDAPPPANYLPPPPNYPVAPQPSNYPPLLPPQSNYLQPPSNYPPSSNYLPPPSNYLPLLPQPTPPNYQAPPPQFAFVQQHHQQQLGSWNNNVPNIVSEKLTRISNWNSYNSWRLGMLDFVQSQNLIGFLDISAHPPPNHDANYNAWRQSDDMVKGWILKAVDDELVRHVVNLESAKDVWLELESLFFASKLTEEEEKEWRDKLKLYKIAISGEWGKAEEFLKQNPDAIKTTLSFNLETPLHIAVGSDTSVSLVEKLVELSDDATLFIRDELGFNPLHIAARTGNHRAAEILINKLPGLAYALSTTGKYKLVPLHLAAEYGHRKTTELLMLHTKDDRLINPFAGQSGLVLLFYLINAGFLDMALTLVNKYPDLARMRSMIGDTALDALASKDATFAQLNIWESLVYWCIQLEMEYSLQEQSLDIEGQDLDKPPRWRKQIQKWHCTLWKSISETVPCVKRLYKRKSMYEQGLRLARSICKHMEPLGSQRAAEIYVRAMLTAARVGHHEIVEVIVDTFPEAIYSIDGSTQSSFLHCAVKNRCEQVFNLLYQTSNHRYHYTNRLDIHGNSILHMAAFLAPPYKLNLVSGAALQMQRELQWFREVEKFVSPHVKEIQNHTGKPPAVIFTEEHSELKAQGEKWMKDTANSCTIAAALIVTIMFAAAITVPGGNQSENGYPMMWRSSAFTIFAISDAVSLFTSTTSLLMFLSVLTSRYAEQDFLYVLPKRLGIGLFTLFLSIFFMMAAFSSTVYLVFGRENTWVLIPAAAITCLTIFFFGWLQFPLLFAVISSTYGNGIFGKHSNRPFH